jgi:7-cyano-7-deazaguanine synthase
MSYGTVVCFSGGIDSAVVLAQAGREGRILAVLFDYDQPHKFELVKARAFCNRRRISFREVKLDIPSSGLLDGPDSGTPVVSGRNALMISAAASLATAEGFARVALGPTAEDAEVFPDCRREFVEAMSEAIQLGGGPEVVAPLLDKLKPEIIGMAVDLNIDLGETWSCYFPEEPPLGPGMSECGECAACKVRHRGIAEWRNGNGG